VLEAVDPLKERPDRGSISRIDARGFDPAETALGRPKAAAISSYYDHSQAVSQKALCGRLPNSRASPEMITVS
jgi:hypothetical protein